MEYVKGQFAKLWIWSKGNVPSDVTSGNPNPSSWGTPMSNFPLGNTGCGNKFVDQMMIINTELCGDWAGNVWNNYGCSGQTGVGSCVDYVRYHGSSMGEAYWSINSIKIYSGGEDPVPAPTPKPANPSGNNFCMPIQGTSGQRLGYDIDYACGQVTCDWPAGCYSLEQKATYAISKYYALKRSVGGTCDFANSAHWSDASASPYQNCLYGNSLSDSLIGAVNQFFIEE